MTSVNEYKKKSGFANYGIWVDIAAPGEGIRSTFPVSVYANWSGTSMATPFVSGQAALIDNVDGSLDPASIEAKIRNSARYICRTRSTAGCWAPATPTSAPASFTFDPGPN